MAANAPYYQMRAGHFSNASNSTNAASAQFVHEDDDYDLTTSAAAPLPLDPLQPSIYTDHTSRQTSADNTFEESHNLAELLEAATTAQTMNMDNAVAVSPQRHGKRKRVSSASPDEAATSFQADDILNTKRRRVDMPTDPQLPEDDHSLHDDSEHADAPPSSESLLKDARAAGVHSAAALFRRASEKTSRKYTRPPMSKLFMSLQLTPEGFLQLQAKAKAYMLDLSHPERQNCVGNRGKGDTDMVKLRLFNCVRDFLNDGVGEKFFGEHVEKPDEREVLEVARALGEEKTYGAEKRLIWPRDGPTIISLVTPLMRRMVTNERQRQYAIETRKGGTKKKEKEGSVEAVVPQQADSRSGQSTEQQLQSNFDPSLSQPQVQPASPLPRTDIVTRFEDHVSPSPTGLAGVEAKAPGSSDEKLPTEFLPIPNLTHINIFLTLAPRGSKPGIKLDETRITLTPPQKNLISYDWTDICQHIIVLLQKAKAKYPEVRSSLVVHKSRIGAENLRGLAAAANALSNENANADEAAISCSPTPTSSEKHLCETSKEADPTASDNPSTHDAGAPFAEETLPTRLTASTLQDKPPFSTDTAPESELLPRYVVKTTGPEGWKTIIDAKDWHSMLLEKAFAIWADGVCNVLVELVDLPQGEVSTATSVESTGKLASGVNKDESVGDGLEKP